MHENLALRSSPETSHGRGVPKLKSAHSLSGDRQNFLECGIPKLEILRNFFNFKLQKLGGSQHLLSHQVSNGGIVIPVQQKFCNLSPRCRKNTRNLWSFIECGIPNSRFYANLLKTGILSWNVESQTWYFTRFVWISNWKTAGSWGGTPSLLSHNRKWRRLH